MHDVYCYGHVSTGVILRIRGQYPAANQYAEIVETLENHCGEATGSALVLRQLGVAVAIEGNWIGDNPECRRTLAFLQERGIDCSGLAVRPGYQGVREVVVSDSSTRTVFGRYIDLLFTTPQWEMPTKERIREARLVCVDPTFGDATLAVARAAHAAGKPLITSDAELESELARLADTVVISEELIRRTHPAALESRAEMEALFDRYVATGKGLVVFTFGAEPVWYARANAGPGAAQRREAPIFPVDVVDTAGAGDSFRGGLAFAMLQGWDDARAIRFACAVAALVCTSAPGCVNPPTLPQVQAFICART